MAPVRSWSVALLGVTGHLVEIEADIGGGLPGFHLVGLPDAALHEAKDRVRAALVNSAVPGRTNGSCRLCRPPACVRPAAGSICSWPVRSGSNRVGVRAVRRGSAAP